MNERDSFALLMARLHVQDEAAAVEVCQRFTGRLLGLARAHLDSWVRRKVDPEDVVQSVYKSFFRRLDAGRFNFHTWDDLWSLLALITVRKCANRADYFRTRSRDASREVTLAEVSAGVVPEPVDPEPTPLEAAVLTETVELLLRGLDADDREVIALSLQGYTVREISRSLGRAERTVRWLRAGVKKRLQHMHAEAVRGR